MKIGIVGAGCYGSALAKVLCKKGYEVCLYDLNKTTIHEINERKSVKGNKIEGNVYGTTDKSKLLENTKYIILALPSKFIRQLIKEIKEFIAEETVIINVSKGFEIETGKRISEVIKEEIENPYVVLSGPSHAEEIMEEHPTVLVSASDNIKIAREVRDIFSGEILRVYSSEDVVGVEISGAVKNILALGAGIITGVGYGDNTLVALIIRGIEELNYIAEINGGNEKTIRGISGIGDTMVTCMSKHSRNRLAGYLIGTGMTTNEAISQISTIVEGIYACEAIKEVLKKDIEKTPIIKAISKICLQKSNPKEEINSIMLRELKDE